MSMIPPPILNQFRSIGEVDRLRTGAKLHENEHFVSPIRQPVPCGIYEMYDVRMAL